MSRFKEERDRMVDEPLPIGEGQTISQPYVVAAMIEAVRPRPGDRALEIGTGSGYSAAVLSHIVVQVYTIERLADLADTVGGRLVIPVGTWRVGQRLVRVVRTAEDDYQYEDLEAVAFVPLIGAEGWPSGERPQ